MQSGRRRQVSTMVVDVPMRSMRLRHRQKIWSSQGRISGKTSYLIDCFHVDMIRSIDSRGRYLGQFMVGTLARKVPFLLPSLRSH